MDEKEARLLQARQLLKKYQNKHHVNGDNSSPSNHLNGHDNCSDAASVTSSRASSVCDGMNNKHYNNSVNNESQQQEISYLKHALDEKDKSYRDVVQKLQTLQTHYAELHTAYNLANQTLQSSTSPEFAEQITKLQGALSVAIEEKTSYQSEVRDAKNKLAVLEAENKTLHGQIQSSTGSSNLHETEKKKLHDETERLARQLKQANADLEKQRRESLILESKIRQVNQDRNDTQSRLKYIFNEKEELEKAVASMKHELQMKEIFIKQLTFNDSDKIEHEKQHQDIFVSLNGEKEKLAAEVQTLSAKLEEVQRQQAGTREYYESCINELNRKISYAEEQLHHAQQEKAELQSGNYQLQEKLNYMISQQAAALIPQQNLTVENNEGITRTISAANLAPVMTNTIDMVEMEALKNSLTSMQMDYSRAADRIRELELVVNEKEMIIDNLEKQILVEKARYDNLQNDVNTQQTVQTDVHLLLEQLQNEKATVSRAIAQNIELKERLVELQDKVVEVTNESASREDQRLTALSAIEKLQRHLDEMIEEKNNPKKIERHESEVQTDMIVEEAAAKSHQHQQTDHVQIHQQTDHAQIHENGSDKVEASNNAFVTPTVEAATPIQVPQEHESKIVFSPQHSPVTSSASSISTSSLTAPPMSRDEIIKTLEDRLENLSKEKKEIQVANDRLQYFLTALESENESIGEYIALYQFQRSNMQKKFAEKDALISQLAFEKKAAQSQISEFQHILYDLFGQSPPVLTASNEEGKKIEADNPIADKLNKILSELQHRHHHASPNSTVSNGSSPSSSPSTTFDDPKLHCPECRGQMFTL